MRPGHRVSQERPGSLSDRRMYYLSQIVFILASLLVLGIVAFTALSWPHRDLVQDFFSNPGRLTTGTITVDFSEHEEYKNLSADFDHLWDDLLTPNGGFFVRKDDDNATVQYGVSMFHQLHCLAMIRTAMSEAMGLRNKQSGHHHSRHVDDMNDDEEVHWLHCFDYLRQTIQCQADATIEPPDLKTHSIDGMGPRQCKDWNTLREATIKSEEQIQL